MVSIGPGWVDGAWIKAAWANGAWAKAADITGTARPNLTEQEIRDGGETIIITLSGDTWKTAGTGPVGSTADTQAIIDGLDAASSPALGWNAEVRDKEVVGAVVRTSNTVVTITLTAAAAYDITVNETITVTVPAAALNGGAAITATPIFTAIAFGLGGIAKRENPLAASPGLLMIRG